jgi:hypothetical protein
MLPCFSALRLGRCRGRLRFAILPSAPRNGVTSKLFPSVVETATGLAGSTLSNSSRGLSRISANEFPCRTSILIISDDSLYIHCITVQAPIFYQNQSLSCCSYRYSESVVEDPKWIGSAAMRAGAKFDKDATARDERLTPSGHHSRLHHRCGSNASRSPKITSEIERQ